MEITEKADQLDIEYIRQQMTEEVLEKLVHHVKNSDSIYQRFYFEQKPKVLPPQNNAKKYFRFRQYQYVEKPIDQVFEFFSEAKNLERITPKQLSFRIDSQSTDEIKEGTEFVYRLKIHGVPAKWKTMIANWKPPNEFVDWQQQGPYSVWYHSHLFIPHKQGTLLIDEVKFVLPFAWISNWLIGWFIKMDVKNIFRYRFKYIRDYYKK